MDRETAVKVGNIHAVIAGLWARLLSTKANDERATISNLYQEEVQKLKNLIGSSEQCCLVNPWLWQSFSDEYKERHGVRPRGEYTEEEVIQLLTKLEGE